MIIPSDQILVPPSTHSYYTLVVALEDETICSGPMLPRIYLLVTHAAALFHSWDVTMEGQLSAPQVFLRYCAKTPHYQV